MSDSLLKKWSNFYYIYKNWVERYKEGITPAISAYIKQAMMRSYFTGASDKEEELKPMMMGEFLAKQIEQIGTLRDRVRELESAIRKHRDQKGDDRCWMDDEELYKILPEGYIPPERDSSVELELCKKFIESRQNPDTTYISPEREIERLKALIPDAPIWATLDLQTDGTTNFKFHVEHGNFIEARETLKKFVEAIQKRIDEQQNCPYYEPESVDKS